MAAWTTCCGSASTRSDAVSPRAGGEQLASGASGIAADELERIVKSRNVVAAILEAAIAALFLEHGYEPIEDAVVAAFSGSPGKTNTSP